MMNTVNFKPHAFVVASIIAIMSFQVQAKDQVQKTGDILQIALPLFTLAASYIGEDDSTGSLQFLKSFAASEFTTLALKNITHERRPNGNCCKSFPSGHTSASFTAASFIQFRYGWKYAIPAYALASYVGYSRVHSKEHYTHDVLAGAAIGIISSHYFTTKYQGFKVTPYAYNDEIGVKFIKHF